MALPLFPWLFTSTDSHTEAGLYHADDELPHDRAPTANGHSNGTSPGWKPKVAGAALILVGSDLLFQRLTGRHLYQGLGFGSGDGREQHGSSPSMTGGVERTLTIGQPPEALYHLWQQPDTAGRVMGHVAQVTPNVDGSHHWIVAGPGDRTMSWDTRVVEERPGELLRWKSLPGAPLMNAGEIRFRPGPPGWGTETSLRVTFKPPWNIPGAALLKLTAPAPDLLLGQALRRFKSLAETGEIPTLTHQPAARDTGRDS